MYYGAVNEKISCGILTLSVGCPQILNRVGELRDELVGNFSVQTNKLIEISNGIEGLKNELIEQFSSQTNSLRRMKALVVSTLVSSVIVIAVIVTVFLIGM